MRSFFESSILLDGRISLTTPEGVSLLLTPAGAPARAWAWFIDFVLWLIVVFFLLFLFGGSKLGNGILFLLLFISYWAYPILSEVYFSGRTVGKTLLGLRVLRADGLPVGWRESSLRNLLLVADFLPAFYFTGLLCLLFDSRFRRLGDIVAGTQVVYFKKNPPLASANGVLSSAFTANFTASTATEPATVLPFSLTPLQQRILADLFEREKTLPTGRLHELGDLAAPLTACQGAESIERLRSIVAGFSQ